jgi:DNA repair exonuclease SbcCD ATPase subunit
MRSEENVATAEITWEELIQLLVERPDWLERVRQVVLTRELLALPETVQELAELQRQTALQVQELVEVQRRHEERLASVEDRLASVEDRLARLEAAVQELVEAQRRHEERLASVEERLASVEDRLASAEDRLARLEAAVQELVEVQRRHEERLASVEDRLASVEDRLASAEDRLARLEATVQELVGALKEISYQVHELAQAVFRLTETVSRLEGTVGDIKGRLLEMAYRDKPYAYFGRLLRSIRVVPFTEIEDSLERSLSRDDVDDLLQLDLLLRGRLRDHPERPEVWLAVEVSSVVDKWDVERARERAALLRKAGFRAVPVAAGLQCLAEAAHKAEIEGVALVTDGSIAHWEQALRSTLD